MDKASVTSPIDSLKNGFEAVYGGYGRRHTEKNVSERMEWSVESDHGRDVKFTRRSPLSAVNQS